MKKQVYLDIDMDYFVKPVYKSSVNNIRLYKDNPCSIEDTHDFFKNLKSKINIPEEKHIFTNHRKSYTYWWMKKAENCTVIHVDAHSDLYRNKQQDLRLISDRDMNCDDYLWYAIRDNFVNEIYWVCPKGVIDYGNDDAAARIISPSMVKSLEITEGKIEIDFEVITRMGDSKTIKLYVLGISDLPYFNNQVILLTMATSPEFIPSFADRLIDEMNLNIGFSMENIEYIKKQHTRMLNVSDEELEKARMMLNI